MKPPGHMAVSLSIGAMVWLITGSTAAVWVALLSGVLVDLDHIPDYYRWLVLDKTDRLFVFLHGYELMVPAAIAAYLSGWDPLAVAGSLAYLGHLLADQAVNSPRPLTYFLSYRILKGFKTSELTAWSAPHLRYHMYREILRLPLVGRTFERVLRRLRGRHPLQ